MGKRGPQKKPTAIDDLQGNPSKRKRPPEPKFSGAVKPPKFLNAAALAEWRRLAPELEPMGLLQSGDVAMFAAYCCAYADFCAANQECNKRGETYTTERGEYVSPWAKLKNESFARMQRAGAKFGLSPADRADLGGPSNKPKETEFERKRAAKMKGNG